MIFHPLALHGAFRVALAPRGDDRGFFARLFCTEEFRAHGLEPEIVQINTSFSREAGTVRGLLFQRTPAADRPSIHFACTTLEKKLADHAGANGEFRTSWSQHPIPLRTSAL